MDSTTPSTTSPEPSQEAANQAAEKVINEGQNSRDSVDTQRPMGVQQKCFDLFYTNNNGLMASKENHKLCSIFNKINRSYYEKWSKEANQLFRLAVMLKKRRKKIFKPGA